jgi:hypothetical protein
MIMIHTLVLLLNLLLNEQALATLARDVLTFGLTNVAIALFLASLVMLRRLHLGQRDVAPSRAPRFMES